MKKNFLILILFLASITVSCGEKVEQNKVDFKQVDIDGSNNERYIFREEIEKEKWRVKRYKKNEF